MKIAKNKLYSGDMITRDLMGQDILALHSYQGIIDTVYRAKYIPSSAYGYTTYSLSYLNYESIKAEDMIQFYQIKMVKAV